MLVAEVTANNFGGEAMAGIRPVRVVRPIEHRALLSLGNKRVSQVNVCDIFRDARDHLPQPLWQIAGLSETLVQG